MIGPQVTELLLVVHIVAIAIWFGGSVMNAIINMSVMKLGRQEANAGLARAETGLGMKVYMPASILTLLSGIGLVLVSDDLYGFGDPWISFGFLVVIVAAVLGPVKFQPLSEAIAEGYESGDVPAAEAAVKEIKVWSAVNSGLLLLAIIAMVVKP